MLVSVVVIPLTLGIGYLVDDPPMPLVVMPKLFAAFLVLGIVSLLIPPLGRYIYLVWYFVAACIGFVLTNLLLAGFFYLFFSVIALFFRWVLKRDALHLKEPNGSMWEEHKTPNQLGRYYRQY